MQNTGHNNVVAPASRARLYYTIAGAAALYIALSVYLYQPYFKYFKSMRYLVVAGSVCGALGCFVLSRRWVSAFGALLFAGAVYGFCPFALGFAAYHPFAILPLAALPWLFCPAVFWSKHHSKKLPTTIASAALSILPFGVIILFFRLCAHTRFGPLFPMPLHTKLHLADALGLVVPMALKPHEFTFGFYQVPLIIGLMGLFMYLAVHRIRVMIVVAAGLVLACTGPVLQTPPIVWALIPALYCSVLIGLAAQALVLTGPADRKWILLCLVTAAVLALVTIPGALKSSAAYEASAKMYVLAAVLMAGIFFITKAGRRWHLLRWLLLSAGLGLDIVLGARFIVDKVF
ncbi:MAG: hypothetical protein ACYTFK_06890 [Planctomycetota bacterium]